MQAASRPFVGHNVLALVDAGTLSRILWATNARNGVHLVKEDKRREPPVLSQVAEGVLVHESEFCQSNTVVVEGRAGALIVDPGIHDHELECLVSDLADSGQAVAAGFSTHPHWDHLLWHEGLGRAPRFGTALCASTVKERLAGGIDPARFGIPADVPLELLGLIDGVPAGTAQIPWEGARVRIIEHHAHAPGHAALLIEERGVLVAGDLLSDVLIPMLDVSAADPIGDYLSALQLLERVAEEVELVVPGHGSIAGRGQVRERIDQDRAYLHALRDGDAVTDPRIGPSAQDGWEWVADVHEGQVQRLGR